MELENLVVKLTIKIPPSLKDAVPIFMDPYPPTYSSVAFNHELLFYWNKNALDTGAYVEVDSHNGYFRDIDI